MVLNLRKARAIIKGTLAKGAEAGFKPLSVVVLDAGGHVLAFERSDGASAGRFEIARGKAYGCIMLGLGGSAIQARGEAQAVFVDAMNGAFDGKFVPVKGGVLLRDAKGVLLGAVGVTGDTSDNDLIAALAGIEAAGLQAEG
ncbi:heme-binding protein [Pseudorhodobacter sp. E13]|uniref:GlcG/HbpS family heme-binding protein n=1 Tax=Pseudorhodobacter sp. E13 TaxID=2487931 RepID=UPI000F8CF421|nr:heme-binding protein [Pseudorhodobacter sp. E13]RUS60021.1 heme-binding protein [Pseudorhodobacter sp. E13]